MYLKYFYDSALAHASYMVGCQRSGTAVIVDPARDIEQYLKEANAQGMQITAVTETHIHADFVSGARELAERVGATLYLSDEGTANWKYQFAHAYPHQFVYDGDTFMVGNIKFEVMHTPGHTPESISFLLTDQGGGADKPMGIFTGDFVFVGSIGRPDLLEKAAGITGTADEGARDLYRSAQRFKQLPDYLQVWPAHGAGSACGKGLGAIPSSTVGYEKLFNPALAYDNEEAFVNYILADQPEPPTYFAVMKRVNKEGPKVLGEATLPPHLAIEQMEEIISNGRLLIDTRPSSQFAQGHVAGSINLPVASFASWAGWFVKHEEPVTLITSPNELPELSRILHKIGVDDIAGYFDATVVANAGLNQQTYKTIAPMEAVEQIKQGTVTLIDVRSDVEWADGRLPNAQHYFLGTLHKTAKQIINGKPIVVQCKSGGRSAIGTSILQAHGATDVLNLQGGITQWANDGLPIEQ